jgi:hypothetical protein
METIQFNGFSYTVTQELTVPRLLALEGMTRQAIIEGKKGATRFLQVWNTGTMRTISERGRSETQHAI